MLRFSIIVPVYNVEKYIEECLNSILKQNYKNYEVIVINDGSLDKSGEICENFSKKNFNFKVIHVKNGGLSSARNIGIKKALGEYILFLDGDDFIAKNCLEDIDNLIKKNNSTDIVFGKIIKYYKDGKTISNNFELEDRKSVV